jgi:hypothetical protein
MKQTDTYISGAEAEPEDALQPEHQPIKLRLPRQPSRLRKGFPIGHPQKLFNTINNRNFGFHFLFKLSLGWLPRTLNLEQCAIEAEVFVHAITQIACEHER